MLRCSRPAAAHSNRVGSPDIKQQGTRAGLVSVTCVYREADPQYFLTVFIDSDRAPVEPPAIHPVEEYPAFKLERNVGAKRTPS